MVNLELPAVNILSKMDLLGAQARKQLDDFLHPNTRDLSSSSMSHHSFNEKYQALTESLGKVLDDYSLVKYFPLDITDEDNISDLFMMIDNTIQFGEDADVKIADHEPLDNDDEKKRSLFQLFLLKFYWLFFIWVMYFECGAT